MLIDTIYGNKTYKGIVEKITKMLDIYSNYMI